MKLKRISAICVAMASIITPTYTGNASSIKASTDVSLTNANDYTPKKAFVSLQSRASKNTEAHNWLNVSTNSATCTSKGQRVYVCTNCGVQRKEDIPALGHSYSWKTVTQPTCHSAGREEYRCTRCQHLRDAREIGYTPHNWSVTSTTATCSNSGIKYSKCTNSGCNATKAETMPPTGVHSYSWRTITQPTCHSAGREEYRCNDCGLLRDAREIGYVNHNWVLTSSTQPTWTQYGYNIYKCSNSGCTATHSETIPKIDCPFSDVDINQQYTADAIQYVNCRGLMNGKGGGIFDPNATLTRAEFATILYSIEKAAHPTINYEKKYADVDISQDANGKYKWYVTPIMFVTANGLMSGYNGNFGVSDPITKEEMAVVLYRYIKWRGNYVFDNKISDEKQEAMQWALTHEIPVSNGTDSNGSQALVSRAECAIAIKNMFNTDGHIEFKPITQHQAEFKNIRTCNNSKCSPLYTNGCCIMSTVNAVGYLTGNTMDIEEAAAVVRNNNLHNCKAGGLSSDTPKVLAKELGSKYGFDFVGSRTFGTVYDATTDNSGYPLPGEYDSVWNDLITNLQKGQVAVVHVAGHYIAIVDYDKTTNKVLVYDSAVYPKGNEYYRCTTIYGDWKSYGDLKYDKNAGKAKKRLFIRSGMYFLTRA